MSVAEVLVLHASIRSIELLYSYATKCLITGYMYWLLVTCTGYWYRSYLPYLAAKYRSELTDGHTTHPIRRTAVHFRRIGPYLFSARIAGSRTTDTEIRS